MDIAPSIAAFVLPTVTPENTLPLIGDALMNRGYRPASTTPPLAGYPRAQDEWLAFASIVAPQPGAVITLVEDIDAVFRVAKWLAEETPHLQFAAIRRYMGGTPVVKFYADGGPLWRDGQDADHELLYDLPMVAPANAKAQLWGDQAASAATAERMLDQLGGSWTTVTSSGNHNGINAWVQRDSPLP